MDPKVRRMLIFQYSLMYHPGDDVMQGMKYTMRLDLLYEMTSPTYCMRLEQITIRECPHVA